MNMVSIGIIEDDQQLTANLEAFIQINFELVHSFSCSSIEKWLSFYDSHKQAEPPHLLFLDIGLPGISGLKAISVIRKAYPETMLIVITGDSTNETVWDAISNGANGYILKPFSLNELKMHIENVKKGGAALSPNIASKLIKRINNHTPTQLSYLENLTKRENQVLEQLVKGLTYKKVSSILNISTGTVNDHIKNIYLKLGVNSKSELIAKLLSNKNELSKL